MFQKMFRCFFDQVVDESCSRLIGVIAYECSKQLCYTYFNLTGLVSELCFVFAE